MNTQLLESMKAFLSEVIPVLRKEESKDLILKAAQLLNSVEVELLQSQIH